jgi:hypothetical protein
VLVQRQLRKYGLQGLIDRIVPFMPMGLAEVELFLRRLLEVKGVCQHALRVFNAFP